MTSVQFSGSSLMIGEAVVSLPYDIREAFALGEQVVVLIDPNAYLNDPSYGKDRRRGHDPIRNLLAFSADGKKIWEAEFPGKADYYYRIHTRQPLSVYSFSSYLCEIDPRNGKILHKTFLK
jgi:hypothetical protein